jgi:hypothetical protein
MAAYPGHWLLTPSGLPWVARSSVSLRTVRVSVRVTLRLAVYRQSVRLGDKPLETHDQYFFSQLNTYGHNPYVTSSLTRRWVCRLQLLLALVSADILMSESRGSHDHILLSQIRDSPNLESQVYVFISPRDKGGPVISPGTGFAFCRLLRLAGLLWKYSTPPPHGVTISRTGRFCSGFIASGLTACNTPPPPFPLLLSSSNLCRGIVFTQPLPRNGRLLWFCYLRFQHACHNIIWTKIARASLCCILHLFRYTLDPPLRGLK